MLANVSSQAKQLLFDNARRVLSEEGAEILREDLVQVREGSGMLCRFSVCDTTVFYTVRRNQ